MPTFFMHCFLIGYQLFLTIRNVSRLRELIAAANVEYPNSDVSHCGLMVVVIV